MVLVSTCVSKSAGSSLGFTLIKWVQMENGLWREPRFIYKLSESFFLCFWPHRLFPATSLKRSAQLGLPTPPHITLHPAHTCWPAVDCHSNYDCQKKSTNVLIWYSGTFITNNWALCSVCERLRILHQEPQFNVCGEYTVLAQSCRSEHLLYVPCHCPLSHIAVSHLSS